MDNTKINDEVKVDKACDIEEIVEESIDITENKQKEEEIESDTESESFKLITEGVKISEYVNDKREPGQ